MVSAAKREMGLGFDSLNHMELITTPIFLHQTCGHDLLNSTTLLRTTLVYCGPTHAYIKKIMVLQHQPPYENRKNMKVAANHVSIIIITVSTRSTQLS
jgi:hypothetical protein